MSDSPPPASPPVRPALAYHLTKGTGPTIVFLPGYASDMSGTKALALEAWAMAADPRVSGEAMYEDLTTDLRPDLASIKTPITLVYPWAETGPTKAMADPLYRGAYAAAPNMTFVDVADSAHFVMLDQPAVFAAALKVFAEGK